MFIFVELQILRKKNKQLNREKGTESNNLKREREGLFKRCSILIVIKESQINVRKCHSVLVETDKNLAVRGEGELVSVLLNSICHTTFQPNGSWA